MKKRISIFVLTAVILAALFSVFFLTQFHSGEKDKTAINSIAQAETAPATANESTPAVKTETAPAATNEPDPVIHIVSFEDMKKAGAGSFDVDYSDYSASIDQMKTRSSIIVLASVTKREQYSQLSVQSTLAISKTIRGPHFDQVRIFQLGAAGDTNILVPGKKYLLFLSKQTDGVYDTFFITGGEQGIISIDDNNIMTASDRIVKDELEKVKKANDEAKALDALEEILSK